MFVMFVIIVFFFSGGIKMIGKKAINRIPLLLLNIHQCHHLLFLDLEYQMVVASTIHRVGDWHPALNLLKLVFFLRVLEMDHSSCPIEHHQLSLAIPEGFNDFHRLVQALPAEKFHSTVNHQRRVLGIH